METNVKKTISWRKAVPNLVLNLWLTLNIENHAGNIKNTKIPKKINEPANRLK